MSAANDAGAGMCLLQKARTLTSEELPLYDWTFDDSALDDDGTLRACLRMFTDLNLIHQFSINHEVGTCSPTSTSSTSYPFSSACEHCRV